MFWTEPIRIEPLCQQCQSIPCKCYDWNRPTVREGGMSLTKEQEAVIEEASNYDWDHVGAKGLPIAERLGRGLYAIVKVLLEENEETNRCWDEANDIVGRYQDDAERLQKQVAEQQKEIESLRSHIDKVVTAHSEHNLKQQAELDRLRALLRKVMEGASGFGVAEEIEKVLGKDKS